MADLLGASPDEIIFTACGTESDNGAIRSALEVFPERRHIITSRVEHPAVLTQCRNLTQKGYRVTEIGVDGAGRLDLDELKAAVDTDTAIVSLMWANNETGVIFPVEEAAAIAKSNGALFHSDAVQAIGKIPINMAASSIDMLSSPVTSCMLPRGSACCTCGAAPRSALFWWVATRRRVAGPVPKTPQPSSHWGRPVNWQASIWRPKTALSKRCVTACRTP